MIFEVADVAAPLWLVISWGLLIGLVFSTVGAAGGILASFGLITVLGVQNPNLVKPTAQALTLLTPLIALPVYYRQCRLVISLALLLGAGGIVGAIIGSSFSVKYLGDMVTFKPVFGLFVLLIAAQISWRVLRKKNKQLSSADRASHNFEEFIELGKSACSIGVKNQHWSFKRFSFEFGAENFHFNPLLPFFTGLGIAVISSALGVGGGFLLVPFMSSIMRLPMFVIAATAAMAIAVSSLTSIANYIRLGAVIDFPLLGFLAVGVVAGSFAGPVISKYFRESWFRLLLGVILFLIGLRYISQV